MRKNGKRQEAMRNAAVEEALYRKAIGYTVTVKKPVKCKLVDFDGGRKSTEREVVETTEEEIRVEPDLKAISYWLEHRQPELWGGDSGADAEELPGGSVILTEVLEADAKGD